jgi:hypothetical protein
MSVFSKLFSNDEKVKFNSDKAANMVQQDREKQRAKQKRSAKPKGLKNRFWSIESLDYHNSKNFESTRKYQWRRRGEEETKNNIGRTW